MHCLPPASGRRRSSWHGRRAGGPGEKKPNQQPVDSAVQPGTRRTTNHCRPVGHHRIGVVGMEIPVVEDLMRVSRCERPRRATARIPRHTPSRIVCSSPAVVLRRPHAPSVWRPCCLLHFSACIASVRRYYTGVVLCYTTTGVLLFWSLLYCWGVEHQFSNNIGGL